jgi:uncharacterized protein (DUF58 family)
VVHEIVVEASAASPLGLFAWRRRVAVVLEAPVDVGPRPVPPPAQARPGHARTAPDDARLGGEGDDLTRGVREYVDGDPIRRLHWPASANRGALMVRELEGPRRPHLVVVVDLRGTDPEGCASIAAGYANAALARGAQVELATAEAAGGRVGAVTNPVQVGRRLARAVPGPPPRGPYPAGAHVERFGTRAET